MGDIGEREERKKAVREEMWKKIIQFSSIRFQ